MPSVHCGNLYSLSITIAKEHVDFLDIKKSEGIGYSQQIRQLIEREIKECQKKKKTKATGKT